MRGLGAWILGTVVAGAVQAQVHAQGIVDVLERSQAQRLAGFAAVDGPRADTVRGSFERLRAALPGGPAVELRVIGGPVIAETLQGRVIVANASLADLPEPERLFVLAHELGHAQLGHWAAMGRLYLRWVPGAVTPARTDPVAEAMARDASRLAYRQEYEADAFALRYLQSAGWGAAPAFAAFGDLGLQRDTATHPGTLRRMAALRAVEAGQDLAGADGGD